MSARRLRRPLVALIALVVAGTLVTGCGQDETERYCEALAEEQENLAELAERADAADTDVLTPVLEAFERLRDEAPTSLADEWDTIVFAYRGLVDAVEEAGVPLAAYTPGERPEGVDRKQARQLTAVAATLVSPRVLSAARGVEDHAREVCDVDFDAAGG